jgi:imidazoleglycerol-phosphate dehydratase
VSAAGRSGIRVDPHGEGSASVDTGLPVLDNLLERLAQYASFDLSLEIEPGAAEAEVAEAGSALGRGLSSPLREGRGYGSAVMTSAEALAEGAGITLHVRLLNGKDTQHVLDAIFKALGVALAGACSEKGGARE